MWCRYEAFRTLRESDGWDALPEARKRAVEGELRDFVLGGVALEVCLGILRSFCIKRAYERHVPAYRQPAVGAFSQHCRCRGTCIAFCARSLPQENCESRSSHCRQGPRSASNVITRSCPACTEGCSGPRACQDEV